MNATFEILNKLKLAFICFLFLYIGTSKTNAQTLLPCGETTVDALVGETYEIPTGVVQIDITLRGADGGGGRRDGNICNNPRAEGGSGAEFKARFNVDVPGGFSLEAGGLLKSFIGRPGGEGSRLCSYINGGPMGGGGGSSAVLYLPPGEDPAGPNWVILAVAGGGGGGGRRTAGNFKGGGGGIMVANPGNNGFSDSGSGDCGDPDPDGECSYPGAGYWCDFNNDFSSCDDDGAGRSMVLSQSFNPFRVALKPDAFATDTGGDDVADLPGGDAAGGDGFTGGGGSRQSAGGGGGGYTGGRSKRFEPGKGGTSFISDEFLGKIQYLIQGEEGGGTRSNGVVKFETLSFSARAKCPEPAVVVQLDNTGNAQIGKMDYIAGTYPDCGGTIELLILDVIQNTTTEIVDTYNFDCTDTNNAFFLTNNVKDPSGTIVESCQILLDVQDQIAPTAIAKDITVTLDANGSATITGSQVDNGSSDECGISSLTVTPNTFDCSHVGDNMVTLTVADNNPVPNISTATATVTVVHNNQAPVALCKNISVPLDASGNVSITAAQIDNGSIDDCGITSMVVSPSDFSCSNIGLNNVTLTVIDGNNESSSCIANITVVDDLPPVVTCQDVTIQLSTNGEAFINPASIGTSTNDNCDGPFMVAISQTTFNCAHLGENTVTYLALDQQGLSGSCTATVTVEDDLPPIANCKNATVQYDASSFPITIDASLINDNSTDNCGIVLTSVSQNSFDCDDTGDHIITLTVEDEQGLSASCTATVTIILNNEPPTAVCQDVMIQLDGNGSATITASEIDGGSTDDCGIQSMTLSETSFNCPSVTTIPVSLTVMDGNNASDVCTAIVTIEDNIAPEVTCQDATIQLGSNGTALINPATVQNSISDNCQTGLYNAIVSPQSFNCNDIGQNTVTLSVEDENGLTASCTATVTIEDNTPPQPSCINTTITLGINGNYTLTASDLFSGGTDNCSTGSLNFQNAAPATVSCADTDAPVTVTVTVDDGNGNIGSCTANVTVEVPSACPEVVRNWTGAVDSDWNNPCNWDPVCVPTTANNVNIFPAPNSPVIAGSTSALIRSITILNGATLTINSGSSLSINGSTGDGLLNYGTVINAGILNIDNTTNNGITMTNSATFNNSGNINIGQNSSSNVKEGIAANNNASFNHQGGVITIDNANKEGIGISLGAIFVNQSIINIGQNEGNIGAEGFNVNFQGQLQNEVNGIINIGNTQSDGLSISSQTDNAGQINIGQGGKLVGGYGIEVNGSANNIFNNLATGTIQIDNTGETGVYLNGVITNNSGQIYIGQNGGAANIAGIGLDLFQGTFNNLAGGSTHISNSTTSILRVRLLSEFNNNACAVVVLNGEIVNIDSGSILNEGQFLVYASEPSQITNFVNEGIIGDVQGSLPLGTPGLINNEIIIAPSGGDCGVVDPAFVLGATVDFNILGVFTDPGGSNSAGTYDLSTNVFTSGIGTGQMTLYVLIEDQASGCTSIVPWHAGLTEDAIPPTVNCKTTTVTLGADGSYQLIEADVFAGGTDDCGTVSFESTDIFMVDCDDLDATLSVTVMANDGNGNIGTCNASITVVENNTLPDNWDDYDLGIVTVGNAYQFAPCEGDGQFHIIGSGNNAMGFNSDNVAFAATALCGDGSIVAKIESVDPNGYGGLMIRETADAGAKQASIFSNLSNMLRHEVRYNTNGVKTVNSFFKPLSYWLKLERQGNWVFSYYSLDGMNFQYVHGVFVPMQQCVEIGLASFTYQVNQQTEVVFSNVSVSGGNGGFTEGQQAETIETASNAFDNTKDVAGFSVFPNPSNGQFTIRFDEAVSEGTVLTIFNTMGQLIERTNIEAYTDQVAYDLSPYTAGSYFLRIENGEEVIMVSEVIIKK